MPWLQRDVRVHRVPAVGLAAAPLLGVLFGLGWTPCIGPTLTGVLSLSTQEATAGRGAFLTLAYCLGLGIPFLVAGLAYRRMLGAVRWVRKHQAWVTRLGGVMLVVVGVLLLTGWWDVLVADLRGWFFPGFTQGCSAMTLTTTRPETPPAEPPEMRPRELLRWAWRQLTSMRTALILLFLLALAAVPGSVVPQAGVNPQLVSSWREHHSTLTPIYDKLGLFDVYGSFWFAAIYLLLFVSLVGCILPRTMVYWRASRALPPAAPRRLSRLPEHRRFATSASMDDVLERARRDLKSRRYRIGPGAESTVSAERGYLREAGNLLFHVAVLVVIVGFGIGSLLGFKVASSRSRARGSATSFPSTTTSSRARSSSPAT